MTTKKKRAHPKAEDRVLMIAPKAAGVQVNTYPRYAVKKRRERNDRKSEQSGVKNKKKNSNK